MTEPRGSISFIDRAPIDITYAHTIDFATPSEQASFWGSKVKFRVSEYQYLRRERRYFRIEKPYEAFDGINYLFFQSRDDSKTYFCFVTERVYVNDEMTEIYFEVDVLQSFMFDYKFMPSYISQGHVDRWDAEHKPIYSRTDEGLNYGAEYVTESAYKLKPDHTVAHGFYLIYTTPIPEGLEDLNHYSGATELDKYSTTVSGNPIPYHIYIIPEFFDSEKSVIIDNSNGDNKISLSNMHEFQRFMSESPLGEYVKQIVYIPYLPFKYSFTETEDGFYPNFDIDFSYVVFENLKKRLYLKLFHIDRIAQGKLEKELASIGAFEGLENHMPNDAMWNDVKANPLTFERDRRFESKLLTFPYRFNIFTDWVSTPALIKNEYLCADTFKFKQSIGFGFNAPRRYWLEEYRNDPEGREASVSQLTPLEQPILSDAYYAYLLQNRNQISANLTNAKISAIANTVGGVVNGAISGGAVGGAFGMVGGALLGGVNSAVNGALNVQSMIRSENAKQADIRNMPDTISNSNDVTLAISDDSTYLTFYRKAITCDFEEQLAQFWHMFGYKVNRVAIPSLRSRMRFNYIKTVGANIEGAIENTFLARIKSIFDNGVTIWHYSETNFRPLDYTYENIERNLL